MDSNKGNILVKIEKQVAEMPGLGQVHMVPYQGTMEGALHIHQHTKLVLMEQCESSHTVQLPGALQNPRAFPEQSSLNMSGGANGQVLINELQPEQLIFPLLLQVVKYNFPAMNTHQVGGDAMLLQHWPLLHAPPSFSFSVQNLNQISMPNKPSDASWPTPCTHLFMGTSDPATNYSVECSSDMSVNSSNRENKLMQYCINQLKMAARPVDKQYPNMINAHHSGAFNYQPVGISRGQESWYSNSFYPLPTGRLPIMLSNQVVMEEDVASSCYPRQGTSQTLCFSPPSAYHDQGLVHQARWKTDQLQEPLNENSRKKVKHNVKDEENVLFPIHHPSEQIMDRKAREFLETLDGLFGRRLSSSSSSRAYRRRGNPPLYSKRSKASNFHVDPILRAFVTAMNKKDNNNRTVVNRRNITI